MVHCHRIIDLYSKYAIILDKEVGDKREFITKLQKHQEPEILYAFLCDDIYTLSLYNPDGESFIEDITNIKLVQFLDIVYGVRDRKDKLKSIVDKMDKFFTNKEGRCLTTEEKKKIGFVLSTISDHRGVRDKIIQELADKIPEPKIDPNTNLPIQNGGFLFWILFKWIIDPWIEKKYGPETADTFEFYRELLLDIIDIVLTLLSFIPAPVGIVFDVINIIYVILRLDLSIDISSGKAALFDVVGIVGSILSLVGSLVSIIPLLGDAIGSSGALVGNFMRLFKTIAKFAFLRRAAKIGTSSVKGLQSFSKGAKGTITASRMASATKYGKNLGAASGFLRGVQEVLRSPEETSPPYAYVAPQPYVQPTYDPYYQPQYVF